ncbi:Ribosomal protein S12 methylthiotransferase RimO [Limihaloglobus sulfuriphilus]|uniref:Ribosomal protein uS12 methylthiotransferase RimO n=1 Tax=Limihaloglobus sulfuriphilus TaxID=1851148 RepID=A0A1Q2MDS5_9BACT|nr:30S ribosomal protein S12 methylthiotransferase RimO [Limihaloglobus sulfuriphilus]AQQ70845.1 Ribosomal protein S12 methylthiotransferase RimO [Limihaloglobus sulfuriphilus]
MNENKKTVAIVSLGCPKNRVDSEVILGRLGASGFTLTGDFENANIIIINTCGFIQPAEEEALGEIEYYANLKDKGKIEKLIVTGCLAQRRAGKLSDKYPQIDAVIGLAGRDSVAEAIEGLYESPETKIVSVSGVLNFIANDSDRMLSTAPHWAYLRISEGCNRTCSFCTIPSIRGPFRSKPMQNILSEAQQLAGAGVKEIHIIAQDSSFYGRDLGIKNGLIKLLKELEQIQGIEWIRVMYLYPANINEQLLECFAGSEKILNYFDIPAQHINNRILKAMKRTDTRESTIALIENIRRIIPDAVIRSTLITGFPGETYEEFSELLEFVSWAKFDALGCFPYYAEEGTAAAELDNQLDDETKNIRVEQIMLTQQDIVFEKNQRMRGRELRILVDMLNAAELDGRSLAAGRYYGQAPEIDSLCYIKGCNAKPGDFIDTKVIQSSGYDLIVKQINP